MATSYWRMVPNAGNFEFYDHLPNGNERSNLTVRIKCQGQYETETLLLDSANAGSLGDYSLVNPWSYPLIVEPADVASETGSTFRDGVYQFHLEYDIDATTYVYDEYFLYVPEIDACINEKLDNYIASSCTKCKESQQLVTLQELVVLRQGAQLDINAGRYTEAANKVTYMSNICTGTGCSCICGC